MLGSSEMWWAAAAAVLVVALLHGNRAAAIPPPLVLCAEPRIWVRRNFLNDSEVDALLEHALGTPRCWEVQPSGRQATCDLEGRAASDLSASALMRSIDARVAAELSAPNISHVERGYLQEYSPGYLTHNLHLDQGSVMVPARIASAIVYLDTQPAGSGHTVFPFACQPRRGSGAGGALREAWNIKLQAGRIASRFFRPGEYGHELFEVARRECAAGAGVRPVRGSAVFFEHRTQGLETIDAAHASCPLPPTPSGKAGAASNKRVLVKIACDGVVR